MRRAKAYLSCGVDQSPVQVRPLSFNDLVKNSIIDDATDNGSQCLGDEDLERAKCKKIEIEKILTCLGFTCTASEKLAVVLRIESDLL